MKKLFFGFSGLVILIIFTFIFTHTSPERAIRANLFFRGYYINSIKTEIYKNGIDEQYGQNYSSKNPSIGPDFYHVNKGFCGLWFVNDRGTGGG